MKIIKSVEPIPVDHPVFLLFGQPGICKSSLAYSAKNPLLLDFDKGAHRAKNRRATLVIDTWADVDELMENRGVLDPYDTIIPDTVGRCLDLMTEDIIEKNPKYARDGSLTQQGWGVLKTRFRTWMTSLRAMGKDVLLVAHQREEKDGDVTVVRPDIPGGSFGEVMKISDFVGFVYMRGRDRVIEFSPTDRWVGKNPAGWKPFVVPPVEKASEFMADLIAKGREALGTLSEESAKVAQSVDDWREQIKTFTKAEEMNRAIVEINKLPQVAQPQVKKLLLEHAKAKGVPFNTSIKAFVDPQPATAA